MNRGTATPMPRPAPPPVAPSTRELPTLDEGDECTEIFGRQPGGAITELAVMATPAAVDTAVEPIDDHTSPTLLAFDAEAFRAMPGSSTPPEDRGDDTTRTDASCVAVAEAAATTSVPEPPPMSEPLGAWKGDVPAALSSADLDSEDGQVVTRVTDLPLAPVRPWPRAPGAAEPAAGPRGSYPKPMTLTPLLPLLPSMTSRTSLAATTTDRPPGALPPPRAPTLPSTPQRVGGTASSPPASSAPLGSSPPALALPSLNPSAASRSEEGLDFDDATLVKSSLGEDELPILLQRRRSVPPTATGTPVPGDEPRESSAPAEAQAEEGPGRRSGLFGRLRGLVR